MHDVFDGFVASKVDFSGGKYFWKGPIPKLSVLYLNLE